MKHSSFESTRLFRSRSFVVGVVVALCWTLMASVAPVAAQPTGATLEYRHRARLVQQVAPEFECGIDATRMIVSGLSHCDMLGAINDVVRMATVLRQEELRLSSEVDAIRRSIVDPYGNSSIGNRLGIVPADIAALVQEYRNAWSDDKSMFGTNQTASQYEADLQTARLDLLTKLQQLAYGRIIPADQALPELISTPTCNSTQPALVPCHPRGSSTVVAERRNGYIVEALFALTAGDHPNPDYVDDFWFLERSPQQRAVVGHADRTATAAVHAFLTHMEKIRVGNLESWMENRSNGYGAGSFGTLIELAYDITAQSVLNDSALDPSSVPARAIVFDNKWGDSLQRLIGPYTTRDPIEFVKQAADSTSPSDAVQSMRRWVDGESANTTKGSGPAGAVILFGAAALGMTAEEAASSPQTVAMFVEAYNVNPAAYGGAVVRVLATVMATASLIKKLGDFAPTLSALASVMLLLEANGELPPLELAKLYIGIAGAIATLAGFPLAWLFGVVGFGITVLIYWPEIVAYATYKDRLEKRMNSVMRELAVNVSDFDTVLANQSSAPPVFPLDTGKAVQSFTITLRRVQDTAPGYSEHGLTFGHYETGSQDLWYDYSAFLFQFLSPWGVQAATLRTPTVDESRVSTARAMAVALERYAADMGTYRVGGGGWKRGGQGWLNAETSYYTKSIANVLVDGGWLHRTAETHDPAHADHSAISSADFMVYRCANRVAVFAKTNALQSPSIDRQWWDDNGCTQAPIVTYEHGYVALSRPLCDKKVASVDMLRGEIAGNDHDVIVGTNGNDVIVAGAGNDRICAGAGNDKIWGGDGLDRIWGENGNDEIAGGANADSVWGGFGEDKIWGEGGNDFLAGNQDNDLILGGAGNDTLHGGYDDDRVYGDAGNDRLVNNRGADVMYGGPGNDDFTGGRDRDQMFGDGGADVMRGHAGNDFMRGGAGDDRMWGGTGDDLVHGDSGNDFVAGNQNEDTVLGGDGNDELHGGYDNDYVNGGAGNDTLVNNRGDDTMDGGPGTDTCRRGNGNDTLISC